MRIRLSFALVLLCPLSVSCGEVVATQIDAGDVDAEVVPDALVPDADLTATASATIHAHYNGTGATGALIEGVTIVSLRPDGSIADTATSDATGAASFDIWPGGSVTAIYPHPTSGDIGHELVTYFGVQPGDTLDFGRNQQVGTGTILGALTASWPSAAGMTSAQAYNSTDYASASPPTLSDTFNFYDYFPTPVDIFYRAYNASGAFKWGYRQDIAVPGGSAALGFWNDFTTSTLSTSGLPAEANYVQLGLSVICNNEDACDSGYISGNPTGGAYTGTIQRAQTGDRAWGQLYLQRDGGFASQNYFEAMPSSASQWTVTNPPAMPWLSGAVANSRVREGSFYVIGEGAYDGLLTRFQWSHYDPITSTSYNSNWYMVMPPRTEGLQTIKLPDLGADLDAVMPQPNDYLNLSIMLMDIQDAAVADYDDLRQLPERTLVNPVSATRLGTFTRVHVSGSSSL